MNGIRKFLNAYSLRDARVNAPPLLDAAADGEVDLDALLLLLLLLLLVLSLLEPVADRILLDDLTDDVGKAPVEADDDDDVADVTDDDVAVEDVS
jgi:hypothetical protein